MGRADNGSVGHGLNGSTNSGGSRWSRVSTRDPLTHFTLYSSGIPRDFLVHAATAINTFILTIC